MSEERLRPQAGLQLHLGGQNDLDVEVSSGRMWVALGPAIEEVNVWLQELAGFDVRVGVERGPDELRITIDRGENQPAWWPQGRGPELVVRINRAERSVTVAAKGPASPVPEVLLARAGS